MIFTQSYSVIIFIFSYFLFIGYSNSYECPRVKKYLSKTTSQKFSDVIQINGSNMILAKLSHDTEPKTFMSLFDLSQNQCSLFIMANDQVQQMTYSQNLNYFIQFFGTLQIKDMQTFSQSTPFSAIPKNIQAIRKSSFDDSQIVMITNTFTTYNFDLKTGQVGISYPQTPTTSSNTPSYFSKDHQLKDFQVLSQMGIGRIDLYDISTQNLIISKTFQGGGLSAIATVIEIPKTNILLVSYGTTQLYLWQISKDIMTNNLVVQETASLNLIRYTPLRMNSFISSNGESYIVLQSGSQEIDIFQAVSNIYRDIYLLHFNTVSSTVEIAEAYPFSALLNSNNWNSNIPPNQISTNDNNRILQAATFISTTQRVYGFSYDAHYLFPLLENSFNNQCDFDLDGNNDSYCRLPIVINSNNLELEKGYFILNDGNIFIANNQQTGFRIFDSNTLLTQISVLPARFYERCNNCVQRLRYSTSNSGSSSNVKSSLSDEIFAFPKRFTLTGMSSTFTSNWQINQGVYFYNYSKKTLNQSDLSSQMAIPSDKINLSWNLVSVYTFNNLIYSCFQYNLPTQNNIQQGQYTGQTQINNLQSYFSQHNIQCYVINQLYQYTSNYKALYQSAINYVTTTQQQFQQTCEVSQSTIELFCMNGQDTLNIWSLDTLNWKRKVTIPSCDSVSTIVVYLYNSIPYILILCPSQLAIVDSTNLSNIFFILKNTSLQTIIIQSSILFAALKSDQSVQMQFYNIDIIIKNKADGILLGQFYDSSSTSPIIALDYQLSTSTIYLANKEVQYSINSMDPQFFTDTISSCDFNIYYSYNNQNNLLSQKQTLITQQNIGYPMSFGSGTKIAPYQNSPQILEGLYGFETFKGMVDFSMRNSGFKINFVINIDNTKQNPLIDYLFSWKIQNHYIKIIPQIIINNQKSTAIVNNEIINLSNWSHFELNNIQFLLNQPSTSEKTVSLNISQGIDVKLIQLNFHSIPRQPSSQNKIEKNLITVTSSTLVIIDSYSIDSQNITSTQALFSISNSKDVRIINLTITNNYIENTILINSSLNYQSLIQNSIINSNTFCSYNLYKKYVQQSNTISDNYNAIVFSTNFNVNNLEISSNNFCTNHNFILGQSTNQIFATNSNILQINTLNYSQNSFLTGIELSALLFDFSLIQQEESEALVSAQVSDITANQNQLKNFNLPSSWQMDPLASSQKTQQEYQLHKQRYLCSYFQFKYIKYFEINTSQIANESICGLINLVDIYQIKLNKLTFSNDQTLPAQLSRVDSLIHIQESTDITITGINISNMKFQNCVAIKLSLEEFVSEKIEISNNSFSNIALTSLLYYFQVNLIYISTGDSDVNIVLNDNVFKQVTVSFSTSSQTLSSSCIASNSLVGEIIMNRNTFNDTYSDSINGALVLNAKTITISQCMFSNNIFAQINIPTLSQDIQVNGGFLKVKSRSIIISETTFTDGVTQFGGVYITPSEKQLSAIFDKCNFINMLAYSSGSAIYLEGSKSTMNLVIQQSLFTNIYMDYSSNYKGDIKAAVHVDANQNADKSNNQITLQNLTLENISGMNNIQRPSYFFSVGSAKITVDKIQAIRFIQNVSAYNRIFKSLKISNNIQIYSSIFSIFSNSDLSATNINIDEPNVNDLIHNLQSSSIVHPALLTLASGSTFYGFNINLINIKSNAQGGIIFASDSPKVELLQLNSTSTNQQQDSSLSINQNLPFEYSWNSLLNFKTVQNITITNSIAYCADIIDSKTLQEVPSECQGRILQAFESLINIQDCTFKNYYLKNGNGTGFSLINMKGQSVIDKVKFENLRNEQSGGAIFAYSNFNTKIDNIFTLKITQSTFYNNTVKQLGGAIAYENDPQSQVIQTIKLDVSDSIFQLNQANIAACIYYNNFLPSISDTTNQFISNQANMGNIIFSQPRKVKLLPSVDIQEADLTKSINYSNLVRSNGTNIQILHASGQKLPTLTFKLYFYDSPAETTSTLYEKEVLIKLLNFEQLSSQVKVYVQKYPLTVTEPTLNIPYSLQGQSNIFFNETGNFIYLNLNMWTEPKLDLNLIFEFSMVKLIDKVNKRIQQSYTYVSQVYTRECSKFETISDPQNIPLINLSQNVTQCNKCPNLTFAYQQTLCQECPVGSICKQDQDLVIQSSYWRRGYDTFQVLKCDDNFGSCQGGSLVGNDLCKEGYIGALCEECDLFSSRWPDSYAKQGQYFCMKCTDMVLSYFILVFLTAFTITLAIISIQSNAYQVQKKIAHSLVQKFKMKKQYNQKKEDDQLNSEQQGNHHMSDDSGAYFKIIASYLQILGSLSSFNIKVPSFLPQVSSSVGNPVRISMQSMDCFLKDYSKAIPYHFYKYILSLTLPVWYYIAVIAIIFIQSRIKKERFQRNYFYSGAVFLFIYLQPDLVQQAINLLSCVQIGEKLYILSNLNEYCYEGNHITYIIYLLIPAILILFLIIPIKLFFLLRKNKAILERIHFRIKWAFLYHEYTPQNFAWEFVKMYEKLIIVIVLSIFNSQHNVKASLMIIILIIYTYLLLRYKPFRESIDNQVELYATFSCIITIVFVVLVIQTEVNSILQVFAMSCMILVNIMTICFILLRVLMNLYEKLLVSKSKFLQRFPRLTEKLTAFFKICSKYVFFNEKIFRIEEQMSQQQNQQLVNKNNNQSLIKQSPSYSVYQASNNQQLNQSISQTIDQSVFNLNSNYQQWYQKYRSSVNKTNLGQSQPKQKANTSGDQQSSKVLANVIAKKAKQGISLNKILNFNIQPHHSIQQPKNSPRGQDQQPNIFTRNQSNQEQKLRDLDNIDSQYSPVLQQLQEEQKYDNHNFINLQKVQDLSKSNGNENISNFVDQKEFFIISENEITMPVSPINLSHLTIQQVYESKGQPFLNK